MESRLDLGIKPIWDEVDRVRDQAAAFLSGCGLAREEIDALTMVACELAENAVKYGDFHGDDLVRVSLVRRPRDVIVEVKNRVNEAGSQDLIAMDKTIQWVRGFQDPFEAYIARLEEVSAKDIYDKESRLGLTRIAYEGQSILDFYIDDTSTLSVSAVFRLQGSSGGPS